jgi:murein DD-endopeptidase MepM/ murein hydrolase activator NlpD
MSRRSSPFVKIALAFGFGFLTATTAVAGPYRLPWAPGVAMELTQDCNDSFFADHVGSGKNAWDFANGMHFPVSVAREGKVTHLKMSSHGGCDTSACVDLANYAVIDHGDGTASIYLHLDGQSLDPSVRCGATVHQGQRLALAGATGWATGPHLHFQVNAVHSNESRECECGEDGLGCGDSEAAWSAFWSSPRFPSVPVSFDEWPANECRDRRVFMPASQNVDLPNDARFTAAGVASRAVNALRSRAPKKSLIVLGIGGKKGAILPPIDRSRPPFPEILGPSPPAPSGVLPRP